MTETGARSVPAALCNASHKTPSPRQPVSVVSTQMGESGSSTVPQPLGFLLRPRLCAFLPRPGGVDQAMCARVAPQCAYPYSSAFFPNNNVFDLFDFFSCIYAKYPVFGDFSCKLYPGLTFTHVASRPEHAPSDFSETTFSLCSVVFVSNAHTKVR